MQGLDGARVERVLELVNIAANKNTVPGDRSALVPGGLRMGTPAMATRGLLPADFATVANLVDRGIKLTKKISESVPGKKLKDFKAVLEDGGKQFPEIAALKQDVVAFARTFPSVGFTL